MLIDSRDKNECFSPVVHNVQSILDFTTTIEQKVYHKI